MWEPGTHQSSPGVLSQHPTPWPARQPLPLHSKQQLSWCCPSGVPPPAALQDRGRGKWGVQWHEGSDLPVPVGEWPHYPQFWRLQRSLKCRVQLEENAFVESHFSCFSTPHVLLWPRFTGLPQLTYLHLEKNRFTTFPKDAFKLVPSLLALHLENNSLTRLESDSLVGAEGLRALYLTGNDLTYVSPRALDQAGDLDTLHLGGNKLKEVPTEALSQVQNLRDLRLSGNTIRWIGPNAFLPVERSLKELYLDNIGLEKVSGLQKWVTLTAGVFSSKTYLDVMFALQLSQHSLAGLGPGLRSLFLEGNQLEEVPDLHPFTSLEVINLADNPLMCDCPLLPLRL